MMDNLPLNFPLVWHGRLVVLAGTAGIREKVEAIYHGFQLQDTEITAARLSSSGTYQTWQLRATIPDYTTLRTLFNALETMPGVKMLI